MGSLEWALIQFYLFPYRKESNTDTRGILAYWEDPLKTLWKGSCQEKSLCFSFTPTQNTSDTRCVGFFSLISTNFIQFNLQFNSILTLTSVRVDPRGEELSPLRPPSTSDCKQLVPGLPTTSVELATNESFPPHTPLIRLFARTAHRTQNIYIYRFYFTVKDMIKDTAVSWKDHRAVFKESQVQGVLSLWSGGAPFSSYTHVFPNWEVIQIL